VHEDAEEVLFLPDATGADWARIFSHAHVYAFGRGEELVSAGDADRALYFLLDGRVRVEGAGTVLKTIEAPSVLGEVAFLDGGPRSATLVAETAGELVRFDMPAFDALAGEDPDLARRMALDLGRVAAVRLRLLSEQMAT
jgi:CRP-like cAMP-binding protein